MFHQKYEKVLKNTQNVSKTVDNHQEQLVLRYDINFSHFSLKNGQKTNIQDPEFVTADNKNAIEIHHLSPQKSMVGTPIGF